MTKAPARAKPLGLAVRRVRERCGYSQRELAERVGVSRAYISRFEVGDFNHPSYTVLTAIATSLGYPSADYLMRLALAVDDTDYRDVDTEVRLVEAWTRLARPIRELLASNASALLVEQTAQRVYHPTAAGVGAVG